MSEDQPDVEVISMCAVATSHPKNAIQMAFSGEMWNAVMRELRNGIERGDCSLRLWFSERFQFRHKRLVQLWW